MSSTELIVVIEPVHYGVGVRTFALDADSQPAGESVPHRDFDAAVAHWTGQGWADPQIIDDRYGRYTVRLTVGVAATGRGDCSENR